jgi:hypothetical protein
MNFTLLYIYIYVCVCVCVQYAISPKMLCKEDNRIGVKWKNPNHPNPPPLLPSLEHSITLINCAEVLSWIEISGRLG